MSETYGMGFKETSDFLKWIGFSKYLAVLDSTNLNFLKNNRFLEGGFVDSRMLSRAKKYYELEDLENQLAENLNLTVSDLDNLILLHHNRLTEIHKKQGQ